MSLLSSSTVSLSVMGSAIRPSIDGFFMSLYASFLTGTIFGFGFIIPSSFLVSLTYIQFGLSIIIGLILVDKLVQNYILETYHTHHHHEKKINTLMLMMSIFREDITRIRNAHKTHSKEIPIKEIEAIIDGLYVVFIDVEKLFSTRNPKKDSMKNIHYLMLLTNIEDSLHSLLQFITFLRNHHIDWKDKSTEFWIQYIIETARKLVSHVDTAKINNPRVSIAVENIGEYADHIEQLLL